MHLYFSGSLGNNLSCRCCESTLQVHIMQRDCSSRQIISLKTITSHNHYSELTHGVGVRHVDSAMIILGMLVLYRRLLLRPQQVVRLHSLSSGLISSNRPAQFTCFFI